jgi:hypothetical protein
LSVGLRRAPLDLGRTSSSVDPPGTSRRALRSSVEGHPIQPTPIPLRPAKIWYSSDCSGGASIGTTGCAKVSANASASSGAASPLCAGSDLLSSTSFVRAVNVIAWQTNLERELLLVGYVASAYGLTGGIGSLGASPISSGLEHLITRMSYGPVFAVTGMLHPLAALIVIFTVKKPIAESIAQEQANAMVDFT